MNYYLHLVWNLTDMATKFHPRYIITGIWLNDVSTYSSLTPHAEHSFICIGVLLLVSFHLAYQSASSNSKIRLNIFLACVKVS